jgi:hypothetical protein
MDASQRDAKQLATRAGPCDKPSYGIRATNIMERLQGENRR